MSTSSLLYAKECRINDQIKIMIPTMREIVPQEDEYYNLVGLLTAMPFDLMVFLDDNGIDYTQINEYDLFLIIFIALRDMDTRLIFGDLDLSKFTITINPANGDEILYDSENDIVIDRAIQDQIANTLRRIHHLKKNHRKAGNEEAKHYLLERARKKLARRKRKKPESQLEPLIVAMVNKEQFKYDYESVLDLTVYQFNKSVRQIAHVVDWDHKMNGIYAGTVNVDKIRPEELDWFRPTD